jgi:hypothetical protein
MYTCIHLFVYSYKNHINVCGALLGKTNIYIYTNNGEYNWDLNGRQQVDDGTAM